LIEKLYYTDQPKMC